MTKRFLKLVALLLAVLSMEGVMAAQDRPVVIMGASYAGGWNPPTLAGLPVVNKGIGGEQSFEVLERFSTDVLELEPKPQAVVIWGFINDIHRGEREQMDRIVERAKDSLRNMVIQARANGITPILATEVTIRGPKGFKQDVVQFVGDLLGKSSYQDYVNQRVLEVNEWIREYAASHDVLLLDFEPLLKDDNHRRVAGYAVDDGSHISDAGYQRLTEYATRKLPAGSLEGEAEPQRETLEGRTMAAK